MRSESTTRLATLGVLALVFLAGAGAGVVADRSLVRAAPGEATEREATERGAMEREATERAATGREATGREGARPRARGDGESRRFIIDRVDLTEEQRVQVDSVLDHFRHRMSDLTEEYQGQYRETIAGARDAIRALLNEKQRATYDSLLARNDERRERGRAPDPSNDES